MPTNDAQLDSIPDNDMGERQEIDLPDGRTMSYTRRGSEYDACVVVLDGPGSRGLAAGAASAAEKLGIGLLAPDRPGFGSTSTPAGAGIPDWPEDCRVLLDKLGIERFGLLTQSGGTPYGLATAAALPDRVIAISLLGAFAPTEDPASVAELGKEPRIGVKLARRAPWLLRLALKPMARAARKDPEKLARKAIEDLPAADRAVLEDPRLWQIHVRATEEILQRPRAIAREIGLLAHPWGFAIEGVHAPAAFWSGELDEVHPTSQSERIAVRLGGAPIHVVPGASNFGLLPVYPEALRFSAGISGDRN
jgi:pimeloyl-ACP methyl ester carboxylesterase